MPSGWRAVCSAVRNHGFIDPWLLLCGRSSRAIAGFETAAGGPLQLLAIAGHTLGIMSGSEGRSRGLPGLGGLRACHAIGAAMRGLAIPISAAVFRRTPSPPKPCPGDPRNVISFHVFRRQRCGPIVSQLPRSPGVARRCHCQPIPDCPTVLSNRQLSRCASRGVLARDCDADALATWKGPTNRPTNGPFDGNYSE